MMLLENYNDEKHLRFAERVIIDSFPENERPSFEKMVHRNDSKFNFKIAVLNNVPVGVFNYWDFSDFIYLEHFAVDASQRNSGIGKQIFSEFLKNDKRQCVFEVELPETEIAQRRIVFYQRLGFVSNDFIYLQPSYFQNKFEIPMRIMSRFPIKEQDFHVIRDSIYKHVYQFNWK